MLASEQIIHAPCAFNPSGATHALCQSMTRNPMRNQSGCCDIQCTCSLRACIACVMQGTDISPCADARSGLCDFHIEHGRLVRKPRLGPKTVVPDRYCRIPGEGSARRAPPILPAEAVDHPEPSIPPPVQHTARKRDALPEPRTARPSTPPAHVPRTGTRGVQGIRVRDPDQADAFIYLQPVELMSRMVTMRDTEGVSASIIAERFGVGASYAYLVMRLERLIPHVRELVTPQDGKPARIPLSSAFELTLIRAEHQQDIADRYANRECSFADVRKYASSPSFRFVGERKKPAKKIVVPAAGRAKVQKHLTMFSGAARRLIFDSESFIETRSSLRALDIDEATRSLMQKQESAVLAKIRLVLESF